MALQITVEVFFELMLLCLGWQWEVAEQKFRESLGKGKTPLYPTQYGFTTVDKIVRILEGLEILTKKQRSVLYKDTRLQHHVLRNVEIAIPASDALGSVLESTKKPLVLICGFADELNRERMLRNMRFYISKVGQAKVAVLAPKYADSLTKEKYLAEIHRQKQTEPQTQAGVAAVMKRYARRVVKETTEEKS